MKKVFSAAAVATFALCGSAQAGLVTILDFEDQTAGTIIDDEYAPLVTVETNSNGSNNAAVIFDTDNPTGNDTDLGGPFTAPAADVGDITTLSPGNVLVISEDARGITCGVDTCSTPDDEGQGGIISFIFSEAVNFFGFDAFDITDGNSTFSVDVFTLDDVLIQSIVVSVSIGDNEFIRASDGIGFIANVGRIDFNFGGSGAIDRLIFETSEIPVPGAIPLLLSGLAGLGWARRKNKAA